MNWSKYCSEVFFISINFGYYDWFVQSVDYGRPIAKAIQSLKRKLTYNDCFMFLIKSFGFNQSVNHSQSKLFHKGKCSEFIW